MSELPTIRDTDLASESVTLLPRRETLDCQIGCVNVSNVVAVNLAVAVNAASVNSWAQALASQYVASAQY